METINATSSQVLWLAQAKPSCQLCPHLDAAIQRKALWRKLEIARTISIRVRGDNVFGAQFAEELVNQLHWRTIRDGQRRLQIHAGQRTNIAQRSESACLVQICAKVERIRADVGARFEQGRNRRLPVSVSLLRVEVHRHVGFVSNDA